MEVWDGTSRGQDELTLSETVDESVLLRKTGDGILEPAHLDLEHLPFLR
jgi:hypothetical protein